MKNFLMRIRANLFLLLFKVIAPIPMLAVAVIVGKLSDKQQKVAANQDERVFWDGIHPTRVIHKSFATYVYNELFTIKDEVK